MSWTRFSPRELRESGLLWEANRLVFWPLGLALTVDYDAETDEYEDNLYIQTLDPPETIVDGIGSEYTADTHPAIRFNRWSSARRAACVIGDAREVFKRITGEEAPWPVDS
jgi:hypothetical protein